MSVATPLTNLGNTAAPQQGVTWQPGAPELNKGNFRRKQNTVKGLAITEIILGSLCILLSILILAVPSYSHISYYGYIYYRLHFGEGLWGGIWIVIAGGLGIATAKENVSRCTINCHMAFSIIGAIAAALIVSFGVTGALINNGSIFYVILYSIEAFVALASMILCIISASYCCILLGCCCQTQMYGAQMLYQQPQVVNQGIHSYQQGYMIQNQPGLQPVPVTTSVSTASYPTQQFTPIVENQQQTPAQKQAEAMENPPSYDNFA